MARTNKYDKEHLEHMSEYERRVLDLYTSVTDRMAVIGASLAGLPPDAVFRMADFPSVGREVDRLLSGLASGIEAVIVNGVRSEWTLSNDKNNELSRRVFGDNIGRLTDAQYRRYFTNNEDALRAFLGRASGPEGLNLSQRVWRYTEPFRKELELGIDLGIRDGRSAAELSRDLRSYLQHPDKLFRRVRDERGQLHLSRAASEYHPGRGVYRSSYMNARRLAATETNIAYRTADYERWQTMDFVVGIEIVLSNNHNCRGVPKGTYYDICDELAGRYPKDFKFTGWHPHCRCHARTILKTPEELDEDNRRLLDGGEPSQDSVNRVDDVPKKFKDWVKDNRERSERTYSKPYFITDNEKYIPKGLREAYGAKLPYQTYAEYEQAMRHNRNRGNFSAEQLKNIKELNAILPVIQGQVMPFGAADGRHPNPKFGIPKAKELGYHHNCQTCTVAYELRRRGFDVEAMANPVYLTSLRGVEYREVDVFYVSHNMDFETRFLSADGKKLRPVKAVGLADNNVAKRQFIDGNTVTQGRYEVYCAWKDEGAHVFIVERQKNGNLLWYDPQTGEKAEEFAERYMSVMDPKRIWVTRIDDAIINPKFAGRLMKSGT